MSSFHHGHDDAIGERVQPEPTPDSTPVDNFYDPALRYLARSAVMAALTQRMMSSLSLSWTQSVVLKDSNRRSSINGAVSAAAVAAAAALEA